MLQAAGTSPNLGALSSWSLAGAVFLVVGPVEETLKLAAAWLCIGRSREYDEPVDGVIYLAAAGLGFATAENLAYSRVTDAGTLLARGLFACCLHASTSGLIGYAWSQVRFHGHSLRTLLAGWLAAVAVHGLYDFVAFGQPRGWLMAMGTVLALIDGVLTLQIGRALDASPFRPAGEPDPE